MDEDRIFLLRDDQLVELAARPYDTEEILQRHLERHPRLLAGEQIAPAEPRRWVVVSREIAMAGEERGVGFVDHAFLDQEGVPTLVEVKRSSDARIRREVVGQMLDYAANAVAYWPATELRALFEANCTAAGADPTEKILELVGDVEDVEAFWEAVNSNLERGRIRMVFVADRIPPELKAIVEFLNQQMSPAEVFAVEVRQYREDASGLVSLVPRVVGNTTEADRRKQRRPASQRWDEASVFARIAERFGTDHQAAARDVYDWARGEGLTIRWGAGSRDGSYTVVAPTTRGPCPFLTVYTTGHVEIRFPLLEAHARFNSSDARRHLVTRLNAIAGIELAPDAHDRQYSMPLRAFVDPDARSTLRSVLHDIASGLDRSDS